MDTSEIYAQRLNAKEVLVPKNRDESIFPYADGTMELAGSDQEVRTSIPTRKLPGQGEDHHDDSQGEAHGSNPAKQQSTDDIETRDDFGSISGNYIYRHHVQPRV